MPETIEDETPTNTIYVELSAAAEEVAVEIPQGSLRLIAGFNTTDRPNLDVPVVAALIIPKPGLDGRKLDDPEEADNLEIQSLRVLADAVQRGLADAVESWLSWAESTDAEQAAEPGNAAG